MGISNIYEKKEIDVGSQVNIYQIRLGLVRFCLFILVENFHTKICPMKNVMESSFSSATIKSYVLIHQILVNVMVVVLLFSLLKSFKMQLTDTNGYISMLTT